MTSWGISWGASPCKLTISKTCRSAGMSSGATPVRSIISTISTGPTSFSSTSAASATADSTSDASNLPSLASISTGSVSASTMAEAIIKAASGPSSTTASTNGAISMDGTSAGADTITAGTSADSTTGSAFTSGMVTGSVTFTSDSVTLFSAPLTSAVASVTAGAPFFKLQEFSPKIPMGPLPDAYLKSNGFKNRVSKGIHRHPYGLLLRSASDEDAE